MKLKQIQRFLGLRAETKKSIYNLALWDMLVLSLTFIFFEIPEE